MIEDLIILGAVFSYCGFVLRRYVKKQKERLQRKLRQLQKRLSLLKKETGKRG